MPTPQVLLDDGSGTFPVDISSRVDMSVGVNISAYGRSNEASSADAATLGLTLDNSDGSFSGQGPGFGIGGFGVTPFGGGYDITPDKTRIRLKVTQGATTVNRFTGRIATSDLDLGSGLPNSECNVDITAADVLADLSRMTLRSMLVEEILGDSPAGYYTFGEASGATSAGDISGNGGMPMTPAGTGAGVLFGTATESIDGDTGVRFSGGQYLSRSSSGNSVFSTVFLVNNMTKPASEVVFAVYRGVGLWLNSSSGVPYLHGPPLSGVSIGPSVNICDGGTHLVGFSVTPGVEWRVWVDDQVDSYASASASIPTGSVSVGQDVTGTIYQWAEFNSVIPDSQVAGYWTLASGGMETTTARLSRLASYAGVTSTATGMSGQLMPPQATAGIAALDAMQTVAQAEGGVLFADGSGNIVLQGRNYRALKTTPTITLNADDVAAGTRVPWDTQSYTDQVTVTRTGGATQVVGVQKFPRYPTSMELPIDTDANALARAQWELAKHSTPAPRMPTASLLPLGSANAEAMLQLDIGDRIAFANLPAQMYTNAGDQVLEGRSETIAQDEWTITPNLVPWSQYSALVLDDPVSGALDAYPISY